MSFAPAPLDGGAGRIMTTSSREKPAIKLKYGRNLKTHEAINRAIRAELPGGSELLDRVRDWHKICQRLGWDATDASGGEALHLTAYRHLIEIADVMEAEIRRRYALPPAPERSDLERGR